MSKLLHIYERLYYCICTYACELVYLNLEMFLRHSYTGVAMHTHWGVGKSGQRVINSCFRAEFQGNRISSIAYTFNTNVKSSLRITYNYYLRLNS